MRQHKKKQFAETSGTRQSKTDKEQDTTTETNEKRNQIKTKNLGLTMVFMKATYV